MNVFVAVLKRLEHVTYESFWFEIQTKLLRSMAANNFAHFDRLPMLNHNSGNVDQAKLDKKRERNRIAASKCRQRKLEKIQTLGKKVKKNTVPRVLISLKNQMILSKVVIITLTL